MPSMPSFQNMVYKYEQHVLVKYSVLICLATLQYYNHNE